MNKGVFTVPAKELLMSLPAYLKTLRETMGFSVQWVSGRLGIKAESIHDYESPQASDELLQSVNATTYRQFLDTQWQSYITQVKDAVTSQRAKHEQGGTVTLERFVSDNKALGQCQVLPASGFNSITSLIAFSLALDGIDVDIEYRD